MHLNLHLRRQLAGVTICLLSGRADAPGYQKSWGKNASDECLGWLELALGLRSRILPALGKENLDLPEKSSFEILYCRLQSEGNGIINVDFFSDPNDLIPSQSIDYLLMMVDSQVWCCSIPIFSQAMTLTIRRY